MKESTSHKILGAIVGALISFIHFGIIMPIVNEQPAKLHVPKADVIVADPHDEGMFRDWRYEPNYYL